MKPKKPKQKAEIFCIDPSKNFGSASSTKKSGSKPPETNFRSAAKKTLEKADCRPSILLPNEGDEIIPFARCLGKAAVTSDLYNKNNEIVEVLYANNKLELNYLNANNFGEAIEKYCKLVRLSSSRSIGTETTKKFTKRNVSLSPGFCKKLLESPTFKANLRNIRFLESVRLPVFKDEKMTLLPIGYDPISMVWTADSVPYETNLPLDEATKWLREYFSQFQFADSGRSLAVIIALALSEYVKYLLPAGTLRCAVATQANSPGAGKTIIFKMALGAVHGSVAATAWPQSNDELRKKIAGIFASGSRLIVFDNVKSMLDSDVLEGVLTSSIWQDRILGASSQSSWQHESQICVSGNNMKIGRDMVRRLLVCNLKQTNERPEERTVARPFSTESLSKDRPCFLAALYAVTKHWIDMGCKPGPTVRGGFEDWSSTIGGILTTAGFEDPIIHVRNTEIDSDDNDFRELIKAMACGRHSEPPSPAINLQSGTTPEKIRNYIFHEELFSDKLANALTNQARGSVVGKILQSWVDRDCAGYRLHHDGKSGARRKYWVECIEEK